MDDALSDRWMPRSRSIQVRQRAADRCLQENPPSQRQDRQEAPRRATPGYAGEAPDLMQGALRLR